MNVVSLSHTHTHAHTHSLSIICTKYKIEMQLNVQEINPKKIYLKKCILVIFLASCMFLL